MKYSKKLLCEDDMNRINAILNNLTYETFETYQIRA
jgi:hypothetical protein